MKSVWFAPVSVAFWLFMTCLDASADGPGKCPFPAPTRYLTDQANLLSKAQIDRLERKLRELDSPETAHMTVYVVPELPESAVLEPVTLACANTWNSGYRGRDNGVLFFLAYGERRFRLEVGRGLEAALPAEILGRITQTEVRPRVVTKDFAGAIERAIDAVYRAVREERSKASKAQGEIVADFESPDGSVVVLVPLLRVQNGHSEPLPQGSQDPGSSVFNEVLDFEVYREGKRVGAFHVTRVKPEFLGAIQKAVGFGEASGFSPRPGDLALSGGPPRTEVPISTIESPAMLSELRRLAERLFPRTIPRNDVAPRTSGMGLAVMRVRGEAKAIRISASGPVLVSYQARADVRCAGRGFPGSVFFVALDREGKFGDPLLSSVMIGDVEAIYGERSDALLGALDIDGDGTAELFLTESSGESADLVVFGYDGHKLVERARVRGRAGS